MLGWTRRLFAAPVFLDEERTRVARLLNVVLLTLLGTSAAAVPIMAIFYGPPWTRDEMFTLASAASMAVLLLGLLVLARRGYQRAASITVLLAISAVTTYWILGTAGIASDTSPLLYPLIIVLAGVLLGGAAAFAFTLLCAVSVIGAYFAEFAGLLQVPDQPITAMDPVIGVMALALTGVLLYYAVDNMIRALAWARTNERAQIAANRQLQALRESLEQRVAQRTADLQRSTRLMEAAVDVSRAATSILEPEELMWQVAERISDRFDLYHVGVFQVLPGARWALYRAGAGQAGKILAEEGFRLEIGGESLVGLCTAHGQAQVVHDTQHGSGRFDHPLLPHTRSEVALPLLARGQILGAISLQSREAGAFDPVDRAATTIASLQTMADQVAVALDNARLYAESQQALEATRRAYGEFSRKSWASLLQARRNWGYIYDDHRIATVAGEWPPQMVQALQTGSLVQGGLVQGGDDRDAAVSIPLRVRDQVIGVLQFSKGDPGAGASAAAEGVPGATWTAEEIDLLEALTHRLGMALESAQLFEETQRRAARERLAAGVAARIRESLDVETVLKTAAQEVRQALDVPEVVVRLAAQSGGNHV
jgi:GAF domain-containing protein